MKFSTKKILLLLLLINILIAPVVFGKDPKIKYSKKDISNYFSGVVYLSQNYTTTGFKYLNKVQSLKNVHSNYSIQFVRSLILLEKFKEASEFSKSVWDDDNYLYEVDIILGLESFLKKDYNNASKHFQRLNKFSEHYLFLENFLSNVLMSWVSAVQNNKKDSLDYLNEIPGRFTNLKKIQKSFLTCYFDTSQSETEIVFKELINSTKTNFSRYDFFLANYLFNNNKNNEAKKIILDKNKNKNSNLLIQHSANSILKNNIKKIKNIFNCKNPTDSIAEIFYLVANLYSTQKNYQLSNFYLKLSLFLNNKFLPNKTLLAENYYNQKKYLLSEIEYKSIKSIGPVYSWFASINLAIIMSDTKKKEKAAKSLETDFKSLSHVNFQHYYEIANFFKDNELFEKSIKYYSLALKEINKDHYLYPKILDRRGTSYERLNIWDKAEKDLLESLEISPDQPHVLNYLAYSWVVKEINMDQSIEMLKKAVKLRNNDGYILDSLGWAYFMSKEYGDAEKFLQQAVKILPMEPVINDHYADALWMLEKNIQARYFWKHVLNLESTEKDLKENVKEKLIFGITKKL